MKKIILIIFLLISLNGYSQTLPQAGEGIKIVPLSELGLSEKELQETQIEINDIKSKGYKEIVSCDAKELMKMRHNDYLFSMKNEKNPYGTDLKRNLKNIKLSFPFNGISFVKPENVLGYAAATTYINGWAGVAEYFNEPGIGICHYLITNIQITQSSIILRQDLVTYDINNKPTEIEIEGEIHSGFLYKVNWYDTKYFHELDCADSEFNNSIKIKMIELAKKIDREIK